MLKKGVIDIPVTDPARFSFAECLVFLSRSEKECLHYVRDGALRQQLQLPAKPSLAAVKELTQHWQQYAAYATFYLWRSLY
jgi:DNA-3-methyladenine glycosylase II